MNENQMERLLYLLEKQNELLSESNNQLKKIEDALFKIYGGLP